MADVKNGEKKKRGRPKKVEATSCVCACGAEISKGRKYCVECAKKKKLDRIKYRNKFKAYVIRKSTIVARLVDGVAVFESLKDMSNSEKWQYLKKRHVDYVNRASEEFKNRH